MMIAKRKIAAMRAMQTLYAMLMSWRFIHLLGVGAAAGAAAIVLALLGVPLFGAPGFFNAYAQGSGDGNSATCAGAAPYNTPPPTTRRPPTPIRPSSGTATPCCPPKAPCKALPAISTGAPAGPSAAGTALP